jgi:tRNA (guanine-N7-)-methyltransferase
VPDTRPPLDPHDSPHDGAAGPDRPHRAVTSFVHHRARLTDGQQRAWDRWWPVRGHEVADLLSGARPYDPPAWFGRTAPLVLEIGSGMGESTAAMAAAAPEVDHLAVEVFEPGIAQLLMRVAEAELTNLVVLRGDAVALLRERVPSGSLDGVRIFFPDPWPKRRHRKRRLVQPDVVAVLADRLRPGGTLHLATDWADYATQMCDVCRGVPALRPATDDAWLPRPQWRPVTKFEQRAREEGRSVRDLLYYKE